MGIISVGGSGGGGGGSGTDGADGNAAGILFTYNSTAGSSDPGAGKIGVDTTTLADIATLRIDDVNSAAANVEAWVSGFAAGDRLNIVSNDPTDSTFLIFQVTGAPTDGAGFWNVPVDYVDGALPSNNESIALQHIYGGEYVRAVDNGDGSYSLQLPDGSPLESVAEVYALSGITISGVETLPAADSVPNGTIVRLHPDNFVGQGANPIGAYVVSDLAAIRWRPHGPQKLFAAQFGTVAAPTLSMTTTGKFNVGVDPKIPAGLLTTGSKLRIRKKFKKVGGTTANIRTYLGTDTTIITNNSSLYQPNTGATADLDVSPEIEVIFTSTTSAFCTRQATLGGGGGATLFADASTLINTAFQMVVAFNANTLAADTVHLYRYEIIWEE